MVQIFDPAPRPSSASMIGEALGMGASKRLGLSDAKQAFQQAQGDPLKLATAMATLLSVSPDLARAAGPMYDAMLRSMQTSAIKKGAGGGFPISQPAGTIGQQEQTITDQTTQPFQQFQPSQLPIGSIGATGAIPLTEATPRIQEKGITAEETLPVAPWTPQQRMSAIDRYLQMGFMPDQARSEALEDEKRYMSSPEQYQKRFELLEKKKLDARNELIRQLETKTQKKGDELYKDIPGEYLIGMEKGLERDIRQNPNKTVDQIADEWSTKALNTAKAKNQFEKLADTTGLEKLWTGKKTLEKLEAYANIFEKSGNQEEYYNLLRQKMKTSPQASASIAFKLRPELKNLVTKNAGRFDPMGRRDDSIDARQLANSLSGKISGDDSLLSIVWEARKKNEFFNQRAFFQYIDKNREMFNLNPRQEREVAEGASDILPFWGDILIFPWLGR